MPHSNFGGNVRWTPREVAAPRSEDELLALLRRHARGRVRAVGAGHSWSPLCATDDLTLDLRHFRDVHVERDADGSVWATVGGGCPLHRLLAELRRQGGYTLPTIGAVTRQTVAGAVATATHGSGGPSLSHHVAGVRLAAYGSDGDVRVVQHDGGHALRAARCSLGASGIVTRLRLPVVPQHAVEHTTRRCASLAEVLAGEATHPLQAFLLVPWAWSWHVWRRRAVPGAWHDDGGARRLARRASALLVTDVGLHAGLRALLAARSPAVVRAAFRRVMPRVLGESGTVVDRADRVLTLRHDLVRHVEMELFVPASRLRLALAIVRHALMVLGGEREAGHHAERARAALADAGLLDGLHALRGTYTHHYPLFCRRVLPDDTLISMTAGAREPSYTISFFHYDARRRASFDAAAAWLARALLATCEARPHWGKLFPLTHAEVVPLYPRLGDFRAECARHDPHGVFRNPFVERVLGVATG